MEAAVLTAAEVAVLLVVMIILTRIVTTTNLKTMMTIAMNYDIRINGSSIRNYSTVHGKYYQPL